MEDDPQSTQELTQEVQVHKQLIEHRRWLDSGGNQGEKADLSDEPLSEVEKEGLFEAVNLENANLQRVDLSGMSLWDAKLSEADLKGANLSEVRLLRADLSEASLWGVDLNNAKLQNACLWNADLWTADLSDANLQDAFLEEADLEDADLKNAKLQRAKLFGAKLRNADLRGAELEDANLSSTSKQQSTPEFPNRNKGADLTGAQLQGAFLQNSDLRNVKGLQAHMIAGANTSDANLPGDVKRFEGLDTIESATKSARKIFIGICFACIYSIFAIFSSGITSSELSHLELLEIGSRNESVAIPIIDVEIPILHFYWVISLLLSIVYIYFHVYLQRIWEEISRLPSVFPDGKTVGQKIHPWLITGIIEKYSSYSYDHDSKYSRVQRLIVIPSLWIMVPVFNLLLFGFSLRDCFVGMFSEYKLWQLCLVIAFLFVTFAATFLMSISTFRTFKSTLQNHK